MKAVITNPAHQHAQVHFWQTTKGDKRVGTWTVPMRESLEVDIPNLEGDDQKAAITEQCRALGLSFKEGKL